MRPIAAAIRTTGVRSRRHEIEARQEVEAVRFVTISRQAGAGGTTLARALEQAINQRGLVTPPWRSYDRELVERIARERAIPSHIVESLEDHSHSWLKDLFSGLWVNQPNTEELALYRSVASAIASLAREGHAIIVGRGGVFITAHIPGGLHVQLVAPAEARIRHMAQQRGVSEEEARKLVKTIDENRKAFYRRYWPSCEMTAELFALTLNAAQLSEDEMVEMVLSLVPGPAGRHVCSTDRP
jgi:cytidylate kinase